MLDKLRIDPTNRLYVSSVDGSVAFLHGLALEDSSPPWTLATYSDKQIELMKGVRHNNLCSLPVTSYIICEDLVINNSFKYSCLMRYLNLIDS